MKLVLKTIFILSFFLSFQSFAYMNDYVSVFKPAKKNKNITELQDNIKKDFFKVRSMLNFKEKKMVGFVKSKNVESKKTPTDI